VKSDSDPRREIAEFELEEAVPRRAFPVRTHCKRGHALTDDNVCDDAATLQRAIAYPAEPR